MTGKGADAERFRRAGELFDAALDLPPERRAAWLEREAGSDPELRAQVERMLGAHERSDGVLDRDPAAPETDLADRLQGAVAGRYEIVRELGRGGMSVVFLAWERKHDRRVVLKLLKPEIAAVYGAERFLREVRIAGRLSHPHIVGLIDSGAAEGLLYYVMPHVEGETLRQRLSRSGPLPLEVARGLLRDVAAALDYAHGQGVIHRDLKPDNVLCAGSHAFLLDFGVAKSIFDTAGDPHLTRTGHAVGTPRYMAPEQLEDAATVDARADLFAWGLLAFEMLTGSPPRLPADRLGEGAGRAFAGALRAARPDVPRGLAELVGWCLEPEPERRPRGAGELLATLDRLAAPAAPGARWRRVAAGGTAALLVAAGALTLQRGLGREGAPAPPALPGPVAVAPFANETGDPALASLGRLAGDWLTGAFQEANLVPVIPWPVALEAAERAEAERDAGRSVDLAGFLRTETGAGTVVTGSFYRVGSSLHFRAEVTDARAGRVLSAPGPVSAPLEAPGEAVSALRDRLLGSLAVSADERLAAIPGLAARPPTFEAYRAFDRGLELFRRQEYRRSTPEFFRAFELDSTFASSLVYAAIALYNQSEYARVDSLLAVLNGRRDRLTAYDDARLEFLGALQAGEGERALAAVRRAAELAPDSKASYNVALTALATNRAREALEVLEGLDPDGAGLRGWAAYWTQLTHALHLTGRHGRELEAAREMGRRHPERRIALVLEVRAAAALGRTPEIERALARAADLPPTTYWSQGAALVVAGEELMAHRRPEDAAPYLERAVGWLESHLAAQPRNESHRYWLGSALYDAGRFEEAARVFEGLAVDFPDDPLYRRLSAFTAARLQGREAAHAWLGEPDRRERGEHAVARARVEAILGEGERAVSLVRDAFRYGVSGLAWLHAAAWRDFAALQDDPAFRRVMDGF